MNKPYLPKEDLNPFMATEPLLPPMEDIPEEFKRWNSQTKWNRLSNDIFFSGVTGLELTPKEGVDPDKALRHLGVTMGGYDTAHGHKEAGCAYLFSLWFEDAKWEVSKKEVQKK